MWQPLGMSKPQRMPRFLNAPRLLSLRIPLCLKSEVYTNSQNLMKEALKRGHQVGTPMSLETGWDFRRADHRKRAYQTVMDEKPFCLIIAFPCGGFSPLQFLNPHGLEGLPQRRQESLELMRFGIELAKLQVREDRHQTLHFGESFA